MKVYMGRMGPQGWPGQVVVKDGDQVRPLKHEMQHSPDGFSWGYGGSGPSDLARSLLADVLGYVPEPAVYQEFKFAVVARWSMDSAWSLTEDWIRAWLESRVSTGKEQGQ